MNPTNAMRSDLPCPAISTQCESLLDRRDFLHVAAGAVATAALASGSSPFAQPAFAQPNKRNIKKCLKFNMIKDSGTILQKFRMLKEVGFDGVEFEVDDAAANLREILAARDATGIEVPGLVAGNNGRKFSHADPVIRAEGIANYRKGLENCRELGGATVLLYPGVVDKQNPYDAVYRRMQESIRAVIPDAERTGVKIACENVWNNFLLSPMEAAAFCDSFDSPMVGWYFDVGNVVTYGWPEQWIRILGKRVFKLDIKEFSRKKRDEEGYRKGFGVELLEGDCDWPAVMKAVDEIGYSGGWGSAEVPGGDAARLRFIAERMDRIFAL